MPVGRILIVDDSRTVRHQIRTVLEHVSDREYEFLEASSPQTALEQFRASKPDLVILDMMIPSIHGGLGVLKAILEEQPDTMIVLLTALPREHPDVRKAIALGALAFIEKPPTLADFERVLEELERRSGRLSRVG